MKEGHIEESGGRSSLFHISPSSIFSLKNSSEEGHYIYVLRQNVCYKYGRPLKQVFAVSLGFSFVWKDTEASAMVHVRGQTAS